MGVNIDKLMIKGIKDIEIAKGINIAKDGGRTLILLAELAGGKYTPLATEVNQKFISKSLINKTMGVKYIIPLPYAVSIAIRDTVVMCGIELSTFKKNILRSTVRNGHRGLFSLVLSSFHDNEYEVLEKINGEMIGYTIFSKRVLTPMEIKELFNSRSKLKKVDIWERYKK